MIELIDVTFIIPLRIESEDRKNNAIITLNYLCKYLETNILILESDKESKMQEIFKYIDKGKSNVRLLFNQNNDEIFHRTKFLNMMLSMVKTSVTVNYDIDILLPPEIYEIAYKKVKSGTDLVYPYFFGDSQYRVKPSGIDKLLKDFDLSVLDSEDSFLWRSEYGHCQFFNTKSYINGGMENENFVSYAPEDQERGYRFKKFGYKLFWNKNFVYHLEHSRGINSCGHNPMCDIGWQLFGDIKKLSDHELKNYYQNQEYLKKYL